jgi:hypothetical protein
MSCWVVPTVAAEYWGVPLDVVCQRMSNGLVPQKTDQGFVFLDVDPWSADSRGKPHHEPPPTFVSTPIEFLDEQSGPIDSSSDSSAPAHQAISEDSSIEHDDDEDAPEASALPELDPEEEATFGRLSWHEVRSRVSRTRRPPAAAA